MKNDLLSQSMNLHVLKLKLRTAMTMTSHCASVHKAIYKVSRLDSGYTAHGLKGITFFFILAHPRRTSNAIRLVTPP